MVPGLSEKRPSLIAGDLIILRVHKAKIAYEGVITRIRDEAIWIQKMDEKYFFYFFLLTITFVHMYKQNF